MLAMRQYYYINVMLNVFIYGWLVAGGCAVLGLCCAVCLIYTALHNESSGYFRQDTSLIRDSIIKASRRT